METRSRKRAEASAPPQTTTSPSSRPSKRARISNSSSAAAIVVASSAMDSSGESSARGKRNQESSSSGKGKEKENERRDRVTAGLNIEDDNESEGASMIHHNFTSASSALQGLLRKLGAGLDDLLPTSMPSSHQSSRLKRILSGLRADGEEGRQVEALTQLCELLSIGTEESLSSFSVDSFVPVLVSLLNHENNPDIMLLAARALTHLCDVLPSSCAAVVHYGAVPCFCARLLTIEYMDLAEQSLQALKKISQEHPTACLRAGALMAVLSYLDFFSTGVQRVALSTAANICKKLPSDAADFVMEAVPLLTNLLHYHDSKVLELASVCLTRIAESFATSSDKLDQLCNYGLVAQAARLISVTSSGGAQASLSTPTYTGLIRLLSTCASGSTLSTKTLLLLQISGTLKEILAGSGAGSNISVSPALTRPPEQMYEIVSLVNELLPPLPQGTISSPAMYTVHAKGIGKLTVGGSEAKQEDANGTVSDASAREKLFTDQPELLAQFGTDLLPVLVQVYGSSVNAPVRHKCLLAISKLMYFSTPDMLKSLLQVTNISSFLAGVLAWKDPQVLIPALQILEILMQKLPDFFSRSFVREGVVHAVDSLILPNQPTPSAQPVSVGKDQDSSSGSAPKSRRNRRRGVLNNETSAMDDSKGLIPGTASSPPATGDVLIPNLNSGLRPAVSAHAKRFKDTYFSSDPDAFNAGATESLCKLKNLCLRLNGNLVDPTSKSKGKSKIVGHSIFDEEQLQSVIAEILEELTKGDGVSTFEFIGSGVVESLLNYFSCGMYCKDNVTDLSSSKFRQQALRRFKMFIEAALPLENAGKDPLMKILVNKLQNALASLERFPVILSHAPRSSSGNASISAGLSALSQPFKLRLCRAQGEKSLRDYSSNVILIDPLATLAAVEQFLWSRIQRSDSGQKSTLSLNASDSGGGQASAAGASSPSASTPPAADSRPNTRSRSSMVTGSSSSKALEESHASSSRGKGKAVMKSLGDESKGPQTRNAARRRAASDRDSQLKQSHVNSGSEDDDLDGSPIHIDEALVIEDDDISNDEDEDHDEVFGDEPVPVCLPESVHDVKLGDSMEEDTVASTTGKFHSQGSSTSGHKVTASTRSGESADAKPGSSLGSKGSLSFAAAAMAGLVSGSGRVGRGSREHFYFHANGSNDPPRLNFYSYGKRLNRSLTVYQAVQRQAVADEDDDERYTASDYASGDGRRLWDNVYTITYQRADPQEEKGVAGGSAPTSSQKASKNDSTSSSTSETTWQQASLLDSILQGDLPCDLERSNSTYNILLLLRVLEGLNRLTPSLRSEAAVDVFVEGKVSTLDVRKVAGPLVPQDAFISSKLTPKLTRQMQDALALCSGSLPSWCHQLTKACPFLFPFETRRQYFHSTAFGLSRALQRLQQQQNADSSNPTNERELRVGRLQRQKVRVSRSRILDSASKVMEMYCSQKAVLEVEYFGEVGTGLGPTLEFYTLLSHELQKTSLGMWRTTLNEPNVNRSSEIETSSMEKEYDVKEEFVHAPFGLFPRPYPPGMDVSNGSQFSKVVEYFRLLGRVMAKALQDGRLLDLPLSTAFYKLVLGQELDIYDISSFDPELGSNLLEMQSLVRRKQFMDSVPGDNRKTISDLSFHGARIEDLCLDFTLPGYSDYLLKPECNDMLVDLDNLEEYVSLVVDAVIKTGIMPQMEAFRAGFNQVFPITSLQIFAANELDYLLCGRRELWVAEKLVDYIKFDHGYTAKSPPIVNLLQIMGEFTPEEQRAFCQFVTGAPRLPPGGLAVLNPKLTIVRKHPTGGNSGLNGCAASDAADGDLPSVMTCANYLKLPPYSSKEVMKARLLYAINEGQGSFDLS
eukprot:TRINITY_DN288_c0_g1_i1.p1 TRINITY_DN288_c0_g1~~TRINITY_DN288_c0_g1_i1.p1  ORF type:complete len:1842 (-),score=375.52 TRINITY_DN288_c0_g1_i1:355-5880(-)